MPLPVSQLTFTNVEGLNTWYEEFKRRNTRLTFSTLCTISESLCKEIHPASMVEIKGSRQEKDAKLAQLMHERLMDMAPIKECAWVASQNMVEKSHAFFESKKDTPMMSWHQRYTYLKANLPTEEDVHAYQQCALAWREEVGFEFNDLTKACTDEVVKVYTVSGEIVTDLKDMLNDMKVRRDAALNGAQPRRAEAVDRQAHVRAFADWLRAGDWRAPCPWGNWEGKNKAGNLLATTATIGLVTNKTFTMQEIEQKIHNMVTDIDASKHEEHYSPEAINKLRHTLSLIPLNARNFQAVQARAGSGFVQQGSAIDTAFSSHYWTWAAGVKPELFPCLSSMLFALGKAPQGRTKLDQKLRDCPFAWAQKFREMFSTIKEDAIHMHPAVLTPGRMASDMVCSFGAFPVADPDLISQGSSSPRFLLNLRSEEQNPAGMTIAALFREFKLAYPDWRNELIVPSEHYLHQSFLSKQGPFVNVYQVQGNALNVTINGVGPRA